MLEPPRYDELPCCQSFPPGSAWGVFGETDELGTLNHLTPAGVLAATQLVTKGAVFPLNWQLEQPDPPLFGRQRIQHHFIDDGSEGVDDYFDSFYPQSSSQWDALSHIGHPDYGFYNGRSLSDIRPGSGNKNGIHNYARRGIVGRFVLADVGRFLARRGRPIACGEAIEVDAEQVQATLDDQGVQLRTGDILILRFGWIEWYERHASPSERQVLATADSPASPGLKRDETSAQWLWDNRLAAVVADNPALEATPFEFTIRDFLHYRLIPLLGLAIGELFDVQHLARDCDRDGSYDGLFVAAPLNKLGGIGSPANAVALK